MDLARRSAVPEAGTSPIPRTAFGVAIATRALLTGGSARARAMLNFLGDPDPQVLHSVEIDEPSIARTLEQILPVLQRRGTRVVSLSELVALEAPAE